MRKLIITLVVLAVILVVADRLTHAAAQRQVARQIAATYDLPNRPEVRIRGFPFLTQALRGQYREIDLTAGQVVVRDVRISRLEVQLADVQAPLQDLLRGDASQVRAETVTGSAVIPYAVVQDHIPGDMQVGVSGENLELTGEASIFGRTLPVTAVVDVSVDGRVITFSPKRIEAGGRSAPPVLQQRFAFQIPLGQLPLQLQPTGISATDSGIRVSATAQDVALIQATG